MARYKLFRDANGWGVWDSAMYRWVIRDESFQICANIEESLNRQAHRGISECDEIAAIYEAVS